MRQKVLITGGSGFLGFHLINAAVQNGYEVYAAVRTKSNIEHLKNLTVQYIGLNYENTEALKEELSAKNYDYIIHAAGVTRAHTLQDYMHVNATYTSNLAKAAASLNGQVKKFVLISSLAAAGPLTGNEQLITEENGEGPVTAYGQSKLQAEKNVAASGIPYIILRPTAIYGPRDKDLFLISSSLQMGLDAYIGKAPQQLSFVHAADVAAAAVKSLMLPEAAGLFNIADGNNYSRYEFADIAKKVLNKKTFRMHLPVSMVRSVLFLVEALHKIRNKVPVVSREKLKELLAENWGCDISKAKQQLGFSPKYNLQDGLEETIAWYKTNKWLK